MARFRIRLAGTGLGFLASLALGCQLDKLVSAPDAHPTGGVVAARLEFTSQPGSATAGVSLRPAVAVTVLDSAGRIVGAFHEPIVISLAANPGNGTLSGTLTATPTNGVATFSDLRVNRAASGYQLGAAASGLSGATSASFMITPGPATRIAFAVQPSNSQVDSPIQPPVTVEALDSLGNIVTDFSGTITTGLATDGSLLGNARLSGTTSVAANRGIATFSNLSIDQPGAGYSLSAALSSGSTVVRSAYFEVAPVVATGPSQASQLQFSVQPQGATTGGLIAPQVAALDTSGAIVTTYTGAVTVALGSNPTGATLLGGQVIDAVGGIAHFPDLSIDRAGTGYTLIASAPGLSGATSAPFDITAPPPQATHLAFAVQPQNVEAGRSIAVQVVVLDDAGHTVTTFDGTVVVTLGGNPGNTTLNGTSTVSAVNGVATFSDLSLTHAGAGYTLTAWSTGLIGATSNAFSVSPGQAAVLAFVTPPSNATVLSTIQPAVQVAASDRWGNVVTDFSGQVHVAIGHDASVLGNASLSGTTTASAINGIAIFPDLHIDEPGAGYTLTANFAGGPPLVTSTSFNVTVL